MATFYKDARQIYRLAALDGLEWLEYGFGTRAADPWTEGPLVLLRQVHSAVCWRVNRVPDKQPAGDALLTSVPGLVLAIRTADCLPILMADPRRQAVAAVHAGWRGTAAEVSIKAIEALRSHFGSRPEDLEVAIGPGICAGCYEVGPKVARRFGAWLPDLVDASGPVALDLAELNRLHLLTAGVPPGNVHFGAPCTACLKAEFHSYRRDGSQAGRMLSVIGIRPR
jgi:hypothetical protein